VVRLRFAGILCGGILCAATFIGEIIAFEFDLFVESLLEKEGMLKSHENLQFWQIAQPLPTPNIVNFGVFRLRGPRYPRPHPLQCRVGAYFGLIL